MGAPHVLVLGAAPFQFTFLVVLFSLVSERAASAAIRNSKFGNIHVHVCVVFSIRGIKWDFREIFLICRGQTQS